MEPTLPKDLSSVLQGLYYVGFALAAVVLGWLGYRKKPGALVKEETTSVVGALVDNRAVEKLVAAMEKLTESLERAHARELEHDKAVEMKEKFETDRRLKELLESLEREKGKS